MLLKIEHVDLLHFHILRKLSTFPHNPLQNTWWMTTVDHDGGTKAIWSDLNEILTLTFLKSRFIENEIKYAT
jgi:hypothetical protein